MKKYVLLSDGKNLSPNTLRFVEQLYAKEPFLLTGAFFHSINYAMLVPVAYATTADSWTAMTRHEQEQYKNEINSFEQFCQRHAIEYRVHEESDNWEIGELIKESRFADMLIVNGEMFFADEEKDQPNYFLREVLTRSECPVLVLPDAMKDIERVVVAYNGDKESMVAMKMFLHTLPVYRHLPAEIAYWVKHAGQEVPNVEYLEEYAARHFINVSIRERFFDANKYLATWLEGQPATLFVCGSYHRSNFSNWLKKSFAEDIIKKHSAAVFVAHAF